MVFCFVVSDVYVVFQSFRSCGLPLFLQCNLEVYSVWHDFIGVVSVRQVVYLISFVQFSFFDQFTNTGGFFDQVDGPVLIDVASVVVVTILFNFVVFISCADVVDQFIFGNDTIFINFYNFTVGSFLSFEAVGCNFQLCSSFQSVSWIRLLCCNECPLIVMVVYCCNIVVVNSSNQLINCSATINSF